MRLGHYLIAAAAVIFTASLLLFKSAASDSGLPESPIENEGAELTRDPLQRSIPVPELGSSGVRAEAGEGMQDRGMALAVHSSAPHASAVTATEEPTEDRSVWLTIVDIPRGENLALTRATAMGAYLAEYSDLNARDLTERRERLRREVRDERRRAFRDIYSSGMYSTIAQGTDLETLELPPAFEHSIVEFFEQPTRPHILFRIPYHQWPHLYEKQWRVEALEELFRVICEAK